jgi:[acyl-carrier-protein] S-malonyltransferase
MGKALADAFPAAKAVFDEVDAALGEKLTAIIWEGPRKRCFNSPRTPSPR